jgi:hypothetical protein
MDELAHSQPLSIPDDETSGVPFDYSTSNTSATITAHGVNGELACPCWLYQLL